VEPPAADALLEDCVGHVQLDDAAHALAGLGEHRVQGLRLGNGAGETIKNEALLAVVILDPILDDPHDDLVGH